MWTPWKRSPILLLVGLMGIVSAYAKTTCYDLQQAFFTTCTDCIGGGAIVRETPVDLCGPGFGWNASAAQCDADVAATTLPTCGDLSDLWDATGCCELATTAQIQFCAHGYMLATDGASYSCSATLPPTPAPTRSPTAAPTAAALTLVDLHLFVNASVPVNGDRRRHARRLAECDPAVDVAAATALLSWGGSPPLTVTNVGCVDSEYTLILSRELDLVVRTDTDSVVAAQQADFNGDVAAVLASATGGFFDDAVTNQIAVRDMPAFLQTTTMNSAQSDTCQLCDVLYGVGFAVTDYDECGTDCTQGRTVKCYNVTNSRVIGDADCQAIATPPVATLECQEGQGSCSNLPFTVLTGDWSPCSAPCGGGTRNRLVQCLDFSTLQVVNDTNCVAYGLTIPASTRACHADSCVTTFTDYGNCSATCDGGTQTRDYTCANANGTTVASFLCQADATAQGLTQACNTQACPGFVVGAFGACNVTCGGGVRTRTITCEDANGNAVDDSVCTDLGQTLLSRTEPCGQIECENFQWQVEGGEDYTPPSRRLALLGPGEPDESRRLTETVAEYDARMLALADTGWYGCTAECYRDEAHRLETKEFRNVYCESTRTRGKQVEPGGKQGCALGGFTKPDDFRSPCGNLPQCEQYYYQAGDWSSCSETCGTGSKTRDVTCYSGTAPANSPAGMSISEVLIGSLKHRAIALQYNVSAIDAGGTMNELIKDSKVKNLDALGLTHKKNVGTCSGGAVGTSPQCAEYPGSAGARADCRAECDAHAWANWMVHHAGSNKCICLEVLATGANSIVAHGSARVFPRVVGTCGTADDMSTIETCNTFPCVTYSFQTTPYSTCSATCDGGTQTRNVFCAGDDNLNATVADELCSGDKPVATVECNTDPCDPCAGQTCSNHGTCTDGACVCDVGWSGAFCGVEAGCDGVIAGDGTCCLGVVVPSDQSCCLGVLDADANCCASPGVLDVCGECDGDSVVIDVIGQCCPGVLASDGICCDQELDGCGVCGGDGTSCATAVSFNLDSPDCASADLATMEITIATQFDIDPALVVLSCDDATRRLTLSTRIAHLLDRRRLNSVGLGFTLTGATTAGGGAVGKNQVAAGMQDLRSQGSIGDVDEVTSEGICGNDVAEVGEQCEADGGNAATCCSADSPFVFRDCPVPSGSTEFCGGNGRCISSSGACDCYTGYVGEDCGACDTTAGYTKVAGECKVVIIRVDCVMSAWEDASLCSAACDGGTKDQARTVVTPAEGIGAPCGSATQTVACNTQPCPTPPPATRPPTASPSDQPTSAPSAGPTPSGATPEPTEAPTVSPAPTNAPTPAGFFVPVYDGYDGPIVANKAFTLEGTAAEQPDGSILLGAAGYISIPPFADADWTVEVAFTPDADRPGQTPYGRQTIYSHGYGSGAASLGDIKLELVNGVWRLHSHNGCCMGGYNLPNFAFGQKYSLVVSSSDTYFAGVRIGDGIGSGSQGATIGYPDPRGSWYLGGVIHSVKYWNADLTALELPTFPPTAAPTTLAPTSTANPSAAPTNAPTTIPPTDAPTTSPAPTTTAPTTAPSGSPTPAPTTAPTAGETGAPTPDGFFMPVRDVYGGGVVALRPFTIEGSAQELGDGTIDLGDTGYLQMDFFAPTTMTVEVRFEVDANHAAGSWWRQTILSFGYGTGATTVGDFKISGGTSLHAHGFAPSPAVAWEFGTQREYVLTVTHDQAATPRSRCYLDGVEMMTGNMDFSTPNGHGFQVGYVLPRGDWYLDGQINSVSWWNAALTPTQVASLSTAPPTSAPTTLAPTASSAPTVSPTDPPTTSPSDAPTASPTTAAPTTAPTAGETGAPTPGGFFMPIRSAYAGGATSARAFTYEGSAQELPDGTVDLGNTGYLQMDFFAPAAMTVEVRFEIDANHASGSWWRQTILSFGYGSGAPTIGDFKISGGTSLHAHGFSPSPAVAWEFGTGRVYTLTVTHDETTNPKSRCYLDGVEVMTGSMPFGTVNTYGFQVGHVLPRGDWYLDGQIHSVNWWDVALTGAQIASMATQPPTSAPTTLAPTTTAAPTTTVAPTPSPTPETFAVKLYETAAAAEYTKVPFTFESGAVENAPDAVDLGATGYIEVDMAPLGNVKTIQVDFTLNSLTGARQTVWNFGYNDGASGGTQMFIESNGQSLAQHKGSGGWGSAQSYTFEVGRRYRLTQTTETSTEFARLNGVGLAGSNLVLGSRSHMQIGYAVPRNAWPLDAVVHSVKMWNEVLVDADIEPPPCEGVNRIAECSSIATTQASDCDAYVEEEGGALVPCGFNGATACERRQVNSADETCAAAGTFAPSAAPTCLYMPATYVGFIPQVSQGYGSFNLVFEDDGGNRVARTDGFEANDVCGWVGATGDLGCVGYGNACAASAFGEDVTTCVQAENTANTYDEWVYATVPAGATQVRVYGRDNNQWVREGIVMVSDDASRWYAMGVFTATCATCDSTFSIPTTFSPCTPAPTAAPSEAPTTTYSPTPQPTELTVQPIYFGVLIDDADAPSAAPSTANTYISGNLKMYTVGGVEVTPDQYSDVTVPSNVNDVCQFGSSATAAFCLGVPSVATKCNHVMVGQAMDVSHCLTDAYTWITMKYENPSDPIRKVAVKARSNGQFLGAYSIIISADGVTWYKYASSFQTPSIWSNYRYFDLGPTGTYAPECTMPNYVGFSVGASQNAGYASFALIQSHSSAEDAGWPHVQYYEPVSTDHLKGSNVCGAATMGNGQGAGMVCLTPHDNALCGTFNIGDDITASCFTTGVDQGMWIEIDQTQSPRGVHFHGRDWSEDRVITNQGPTSGYFVYSSDGTTWYNALELTSADAHVFDICLFAP